MKINELVQVGIRTEERTVVTYDEDGNAVENVEAVEVPIMEAITRDMTPEEEAEHEAIAASMPEPEPTQEQRIAELEDALIELAAIMTEVD